MTGSSADALRVGPGTVIAWDFDGVVNRNIRDGRFIWADRFEADLGHSLAVFTKAIFADGFDDVITGRVDLRDRVEDWASRVGFSGGADLLLDYWFSKDALPDTKVLGMMEALEARGIRQVIATNNEARRAAFIEGEMGFGARVEQVFASGRLGVRKPAPEFYARVTGVLEVDPGNMVLIDDHAGNVAAAIDCGWRGVHFTSDLRDRLATVLGLDPSG